MDTISNKIRAIEHSLLEISEYPIIGWIVGGWVTGALMALYDLDWEIGQICKTVQSDKTKQDSEKVPEKA